MAKDPKGQTPKRKLDAPDGPSATRLDVLSDLLQRIPRKHLRLIPGDLLFRAIPLGERRALNDLAGTLNAEIANRKKLSKEKPGTGVRAQGTMPDSVINTLALAMLDACIDLAHVPPKTLRDIFVAQLDIKVRSAAQRRRTGARVLATLHFAKHPDTGVREAARAVNVSDATIRRWLDEPIEKTDRFLTQVEETRFLLGVLAKNPA